MRKIVFVLLMACSALAQAQSESKAVSSFKAMIETASKQVHFTDVFFNTHHNGWSRSYVEIRDVRYDVKKTDSAINPLVGHVNLVALNKASKVYSSKDEAERSTDTQPVTMAQDYSITYKLVGGKWKADRAMYETSIVGRSVPGALKHVLEYKPKPRKDMGALDRALEKWLPGMY